MKFNHQRAPAHRGVLEDQLAGVAAPHAQLVQLLGGGEALRKEGERGRRLLTHNAMPSLSSFWAAEKPCAGGRQLRDTSGIIIGAMRGSAPAIGSRRPAKPILLQRASSSSRSSSMPNAECTAAAAAAAQRSAHSVAQRAQRTSMPFSTMKAVMPCAPFSGAVLAYTISVSAGGY